MKTKRFFALMLFCAYVFSSCAVVGYDTSAKFDSGYFTEDGSYVLNCKGINDLAIACKTNLADIDKITSLTLKYMDNTNINVISKFKNLKELTITNSDLAEKDISLLSDNIGSLVLYACKNIDYTLIPDTISALSLYDNKDVDLEAVSEMDNITSLSLTYSNIARQSELSLLKQLTMLEIIGDPISDDSLIMPFISDLKNLKVLRIYNLDCLKFDAISNLKQLEELTCTNSGNISYETLSELSGLEILDTVGHGFSNGQIYSSDVFDYTDGMSFNSDDGFISAIENMPDLQVLRCKGYPSSKLKACKNLKEVMLVCNRADLNDFDGLDKLEKLSLAVNDVLPSKTSMDIKEFEYCDTDAKGDLSFIGDLSELEALKVKYSNAFGIGTDMSYIGNCTKLKSLMICDYFCTKKESFDISFLSALENLEYLCLEHIKIQNIIPISNLYNLKVLTISDCCLCNIEALSSLNLLEYVDLTYNMISNISPLENLKCISHLDLKHNKIKNINIVSGLENIKYLDISYNDIKKINAVSDLNNMEYLDIAGNYIRNFKPISGKFKLKYLDISFNKINSSAWANDLNSLDELEAKDYWSADLDFIYSFPSILKMDIRVRDEVIADLDQFDEECDVHMDSFSDCDVYIGYIFESDIYTVYN